MTHKIDLDKINEIFPNAYFDFAVGCSEPSYDDKPVILANWNHVPDKVFQALESHGFSCEWSDEWITCGVCGKAFRSSPDSYHWEMSGVIFDSEVFCVDCIPVNEYYESLENHPNSAVTWPIAEKYNPSDYGYELLQDKYENGWYPGQNDNPKDILKLCLEKYPNDKFLFVIDGQGQFDIEFSIYKRIQESEE